MAQHETGLSKLIARQTEQTRRKHLAADERKRHAARTTEELKRRYGVADDE